eukprot:1718325-Rhodomonas_salina.1
MSVGAERCARCARSLRSNANGPTETRGRGSEALRRTTRVRISSCSTAGRYPCGAPCASTSPRTSGFARHTVRRELPPADTTLRLVRRD